MVERAGNNAIVLRRGELAAFLRSRRERITPEDVGLPGGHRRRTAGLRREEVAQLAGVGVTWYTWLEQGRPIRASVQVLEAVARTLRLDTVERQHLFRLAEVPDAATPDHDGQLLRPQIQAILDGLSPMPASVVTERFDILAWNAAYAVLLPRTIEGPAAERNTLLACFAKADCCSAIENRADQRAAMVAQLRAAYGHHVGDPAWTSFIRRMEAVSPAFAADPWNVGIIAPTTGALSTVGTRQLSVVQWWAQDINAKGGIRGRQINLIHCNDEASPEKSVTCTRDLMSRNVVL